MLESWIGGSATFRRRAAIRRAVARGPWVIIGLAASYPPFHPPMIQDL